jgi:hypothetical protein
VRPGLHVLPRADRRSARRSRGSYYSTIHHGWSWGAFIVAALVIVAVLRLLGGRWRLRCPVTLGLLVTALAPNTAIVVSLPGYTI